MPFSSIKVGNAFLRLGGQAPPHPLPPIKLMKLVYIANGWHLFFHEQPLIDESPEAWLYGPGIPKLYQRIRSYGLSPVLPPIEGDTDSRDLDEAALEIIRLVFETYADYGGTQLSNLTNHSGTSWAQVWKQFQHNATIPAGLIRQHYTTLFETAERRDAAARITAA